MFILEKPYVSGFLVDTLVQNDWPVLDNDIIETADIEEGAFRLWSKKGAIDYYLKQEFPLIYSNSENAISWILENLPRSNLSTYINLFKNKIAFRELLSDLYPDFYYRAVEYSLLQSIIPTDLRYPVVLKPAVGFLSLGVHTIKNADDWKTALQLLSDEMKQASELYPKNVINSSKFIIEELIQGEEYAIDAYFDRNGDPVILNIFQHPFFDENDVKDRLYITSADIMIRYMAKFAILLRKISELKNVRNLPIHLEVRVNQKGDVIPIEINPMRFAGWCTTDVAKYAWNINPYEYFYKQKMPDWNNIIANANRQIYYFSMAEVPTDIPKDKILGFNYEAFLANYSNILELRRINYKTNPLFAIIFGTLTDEDEIKRIVAIKTKDYIKI